VGHLIESFLKPEAAPKYLLYLSQREYYQEIRN
jgi:hypothetical protein